MTNKSNLTINHLYSKNLNIYGDLGNIIALQYLARTQPLGLSVVNTEIGDKKLHVAEIYFIGGGQDNDQLLVYKDLLRYKDQLQEEAAKGKIFLLVCGGFQLFGNYFVGGEGQMIKGLGILDMETRAPDYKVASRCIGNIVVEMAKEFVENWQIDTAFSKYLVGFENHGGQSFLNPKLRPIGRVVKGFGNNAGEKVEGAWTKNIIGTYLHGSLLPKNPHLGEAILRRALRNKYGTSEFTKRDFELEKKAHEAVIRMI